MDTALIFIIAISCLIKNKFKKEKYDYLNKAKEIYTIYFWKNKGINSIKYYYPDFHERKNSLAYATAFYQYKFLVFGLLNTNKYNNIIAIKIILSLIIL